MPKLNPNAQKWVRALRSGKYRQAKKQLRRGDAFCCLGVACDLAKKDLGIKWDDDNHFDGEFSFLTPSVQSWLGLSGPTGRIDALGTSLTQLNDNGTRFRTIANLIEKYAEELGVSA